MPSISARSLSMAAIRELSDAFSTLAISPITSFASFTVPGVLYTYKGIFIPRISFIFSGDTQSGMMTRSGLTDNRDSLLDFTRPLT